MRGTRSVAGLFALGVSLILALGILSSMVTGNLDIRIIQNAAMGGPREGYHNLLGSVGAHAGYFLARQGLGIGALALPFLLGLLGLRWLTDRPLLPLGRTLQLTAILAMYVPYAIGFLTNTVQAEGDPGTSFLDDHIVGAAGLWAVGTLIHLGGFPGAGIVAGLSRCNHGLLRSVALETIAPKGGLAPALFNRSHGCGRRRGRSGFATRCCSIG